MKWWRFWGDRRAWKRAQRTHAYEHANNMTPSLHCSAVGHNWDPPSKYGEGYDSYDDMFDKDDRRKFCQATGRPW